MKRIYSGKPIGSELPIRGYRVYIHTGSRITPISRVEFDRDTDRGMATVTTCVRTVDGQFILDPEKNEVVAVSFRAWVQILPEGQNPPILPADDLTRNPFPSIDSEPFVLFSEIEDMAGAIKANAGAA